LEKKKMKTSHIIIILGIVISSSIVFAILFESPFREEYYEIEITGMKDIYLVGEQYDFSYIISGYGYQCGSKKVSFPDQNGEITKIISSSSCIAGVPMEEFVFDIQKEYGTTFGHIALNNPGTYTVSVTFDRPNQNFPTTVSKEFRVPPINSWYYNQMSDTDLQTVMDSCANDSPKERMANSLRYSNGTHVFLNLGCEWKKIGKFMSDADNTNAERDAKLAAGYKLYPGVGWVHPDDLGNQQPIYRDNPNNPGELVLDIDAMIAESETNFHPCQQLAFDAFANTTLKQTPNPNSTLSVGYGDGENEEFLRSIGCFENRDEWQTQEFLDYLNGLIENEN
jgi:hypothetical protein